MGQKHDGQVVKELLHGESLEATEVCNGVQADSSSTRLRSKGSESHRSMAKSYR